MEIIFYETTRRGGGEDIVRGVSRMEGKGGDKHGENKKKDNKGVKGRESARDI